MTRDAWFRNTTWNPAIAATFEAKLRRARRKGQYLRLQASQLATTMPAVAHSLLDQYFAQPDQWDAAQAHVERAQAYLSQGLVEEAIAAFADALAREREFPSVKTQAYVELPFEVATRRLERHYKQALEILEAHRSRVVFPVENFKWNAAQALIAWDSRPAGDYSSFAKAAILAADRANSGFRHHPGIGLVPTNLSPIVTEMRRLCAV